MKFGQLTDPTILEAFTPATLVTSEMDIEHTPLYDSVDLDEGDAVSENSVQFFVNIGPGFGKTLADTNMQLSRQLPSPEVFSILAIHLRWQEDIAETDVLNLVRYAALEFYLGDKCYNRAPLWFYVAGGGIFTTATDFYANGLPGRMNGHRLAIPLVIENTQNFYAKLVGTPFNLASLASGGTGLRLQCLLDGYYARGVR